MRSMILLTVLLIVSVRAAAAGESRPKQVRVTATAAKVTAAGRTLAVLRRGEVVDVLKWQPPWAAVRFPRHGREVKGWVAVKAVEAVVEKRPKPAEDPDKKPLPKLRPEPTPDPKPPKPVPSGPVTLEIRETKLGAEADVWCSKHWTARPRPSPDRRSVAYFVRRNGRMVLVLDGAVKKEFVGPKDEPVKYGWLYFSPNGVHVAWIAQRADGREYLVVDGRSGRPYDDVHPPKFSANSRHVAYVAERNDKYVMVLDGREGTPYDYIFGSPGSLLLSRDGARVIYVAARGRQFFLVAGGRERGPHDAISSVRVIDGPRGQHIAYAVRKGQTTTIFVDSRKVDTCPARVYGRLTISSASSLYTGLASTTGVSFLSISPDGKRFAYFRRCSEHQKDLVVDGRTWMERCSTGWSHNIEFSADSRRVACKVSQFKVRDKLMVDGQWLAGSRDASGNAHFSPDGRRLAYFYRVKERPPGAKKAVDRYGVCVDGRRGPLFDQVSGPIVFSLDSRHTVYWAKEGTEDFRAVVNDRKTGVYNLIDGLGAGRRGVVFDGPNRFHFLACDGKEFTGRFLCVEVTIKPTAPASGQSTATPEH